MNMISENRLKVMAKDVKEMHLVSVIFCQSKVTDFLKGNRKFRLLSKDISSCIKLLDHIRVHFKEVQNIPDYIKGGDYYNNSVPIQLELSNYLHSHNLVSSLDPSGTSRLAFINSGCMVNNKFVYDNPVIYSPLKATVTDSVEYWRNSVYSYFRNDGLISESVASINNFISSIIRDRDSQYLLF